jgi:hypothetical protein
MEIERCLDCLESIGNSIRERLMVSVNKLSTEVKSAVHKYGHDDIIYRIDKDVEDLIISGLSKYSAEMGGLVLIAEGIGGIES